jgi:hypothetical protein
VTQLRKSSQPASELHQRSSKCPEGKRNEHPFSHRSNHRVRFWLVSAPDHFTKPDDMSQYAKAKRVPFPKVAVAGTGVLELLGGASMLLGAHPTIGIILLIVFMLGSTFPMHNFLDSERPADEAGRHDSFPEKHGDRGSASHALGHTATVAV